MRKNNVGYGLLIGAIAPLIAFLFTTYTSLGERLGDKPLLLYAFAGLINLWEVRICYKKQFTKTAAGIIAITFASVLLLILFKRKIMV